MEAEVLKMSTSTKAANKTIINFTLEDIETKDIQIKLKIFMKMRCLTIIMTNMIMIMDHK